MRERRKLAAVEPSMGVAVAASALLPEENEKKEREGEERRNSKDRARKKRGNMT